MFLSLQPWLRVAKKFSDEMKMRGEISEHRELNVIYAFNNDDDKTG